MPEKNIDYASLKGLPVANTYLDEIIQDNLYYVDKTPYIKKVFQDNTSKVLLIARPRRFGKSLAMDTFKRFLRINPENPGDTSYQEQIFKDTKIYENKEFCRKFMGRYPVISLSLKAVSGTSFALARENLAGSIAMIADDFEYLAHSTLFSSDELDKFKFLKNEDLLGREEHQSKLEKSLLLLAKMLYRYYGQKVVLLIDEYDVPVARSYEKGYYDDMVELIRNLLIYVLKENDYFKKAVLTGCLHISKESIFTGLNNPDVNTVTSDRNEFAECMGFTKDEVRTMLNYYGLSEYEGAVKDWYDGYRIGDSEIFCPWDVIKYLNDARNDLKNGRKVLAPQSYWSATGSNNLIEEFMPYLDEQAVDGMQTLLDGGQIAITINDDLNYREIGRSHKVNDFWTLLVYTGYLTAVETDEQGKICTVRIPNKEIREAFKDCIVEYYNSTPLTKESNDIAECLLKGDADKANDLLEDRLARFVSCRDFATPSRPENFYQVFLNGIFSIQSSDIFKEYRSNEAAGDGYADITFKGKKTRTAVVIEIKVTSDENRLEKLAGDALKQIDEKKYAAAVSSHRIKTIYCYGISFCRKSCCVLCKEKHLYTALIK